MVHYKIFLEAVFSLEKLYIFKNKKKSLTLGTLSLLQTPSDKSRSRISQEKTEGHSLLYSEMRLTTLGVATRGLDPPI